MSQEESQILFTASTTSLSHLSNVLSSITPVGAKSLVVINEKGLFFIVNDINICKVQLNLDSDFFDSFVYNNNIPSTLVNEDSDVPTSKNVRFGIDIHSLLESVTIANSYSTPFNSGAQQALQQLQQQQLKTNCILSYQGYGHPFVLSFEDERMLERVEFQTFNIDEDEDEDEGFFEIDNDKLVLEIILKGSILYDILRDLKEIQTEQVYIYCDTKNDVSSLIFISKGELGYSKMMFPRKKRLLEEMNIYKMVKLPVVDQPGFSFPKDDEYEYIKTDEDSITSFYNFNYFSKLLKAAKLASKIKFKKDSNGLTSIILLLKDESYNKRSSSSTTMIEFKLLEFINPYSHDHDDSTTTTAVLNNNFNNSYIQNLIEDDDVIQLELNVVTDQQQQQIDDFLKPLQPLPQTLYNTDPRYGSDVLNNQADKRVSILDKFQKLNYHDDNNNILANSTVVTNDGNNNGKTPGDNDNDDRNKRHKSRKKNPNDGGINIVGGAIEHPIFL